MRTRIMTGRTLVIIPTYNEKENIERFLPVVLEQDPLLDVLVVDDNSPDGTGLLVREMMKSSPRIHLLQRSGKLGLGTAYIAGFKWGLERDYDFFQEIDADFSHDPREIPNFLKAIQEHDLVIGSRYKDGIRVVNWPLSRLMLSKGAAWYVRIVTGLPVADPTGGYKCFRRAVLEAINLDTVKSNGYAFQVELSYRAWMNGFRIHEIPITFVDRLAGQSKMSGGIVREAVVVVLMLAHSQRFRRRPRNRPVDERASQR
jgi:dolichol-phosphate mannosyltransferase